MTESVYFFDDNQKLIKIVGEDQIVEDVQEKELTTDKSALLNDKLSVSVLEDSKIKDSKFMAVREDESSFSVYKILVDSDPEGMLSFSGVNFAPDELDAYVVTDIRPQNKSIKAVAEQIFGFTGGEWRVGYVDPTLPAISGTFYYISVKEAIKQLQTFGCEVLFKCDVTGEGITDKWIEIYKQIGEVSNKRFEYGEDALEVVRKRDRSQLFTSLIGRGKGEDVGDGYGRRIDFASVRWSKANGDPLDKPVGQNWLEYPEMTTLHGIPTKSGKKRKRETVVVFQDIEEPGELLQATYEKLLECSRPLIQFTTKVLGGDAIGNTVTIHNYQKDYHYRVRVFSTKLNRLTGAVDAGLGDNLNSSSSRQSSAMQSSISNLAETKMSFYDSTEISKWQSDIIRGAKGGAVILMSPSDFPADSPQYGESREPFQQVWMDGDSIATSSHFLVANSDGIGFINGDFYENEFKTAWTIDGKFNADFIQTGKILAEIFETSFNALGDVLRLVSGALQIQNNGKKIMELTKKGMEFWNSTESIGTIGTTDSAGNPFPDAQTPTPIEENALVIRANGSGKYILLSALEGKGFVMLGNGTTFHIGDLNVYGKLRINGQEVYPGQGGGPSNPGDWDGNYPPEVTTSADKFAWELWVFLLSKGYSKASIAGILGNVQGEVGEGMNPDTAQVGGPAYGIVQWDGSAYPLVGPPTYDGRAYVTNLFNAAGITDEISSMNGQAKLLDWCMYNGQWLGRVNPTSVSGFKTMTDPQAAAYTFEENFERPATAHPERQGWAQAWYDKFKDLTVTQPNNDIVSIARSWLGWFYYVQLHPSSDLGDLKNPNKSGGTDCSGFVWLVLYKAGYRVPANMQWYTGSMTSDARGSHSWLTEITASQSRAGDIVIYNQGDGAGNNGHTAILLEPYKGNDTQIIEMGGDSRYTGVNISTIGYAFGSLLSGDRCLARGVK